MMDSLAKMFSVMYYKLSLFWSIFSRIILKNTFANIYRNVKELNEFTSICITLLSMILWMTYKLRLIIASLEGDFLIAKRQSVEEFGVVRMYNSKKNHYYMSHYIVFFFKWIHLLYYQIISIFDCLSCRGIHYVYLMTPFEWSSSWKSVLSSSKYSLSLTCSSIVNKNNLE